MLAIHRLLSRQPITPEVVGKFLDEHTFPLVEGMHATFVYHGEADTVLLRHWVYGLPQAPAFTQVAGTSLWFVVLELPMGSRVEYKIEVKQHGRSRWLRDPLNPLLAHDPFGANSVCHGLGYEIPEWIEPNPEARKGKLHQLVVEETAFGGPRPVTVYLPARFRRRRRYPLMVVHDGGDYLNYTRMQTVLDNLIHDSEVAPLIVAFTHPTDRMVEYPDDPRHATFIAEQLVPYLEKRLPLYAQPQWRGLMGASFGAVATLSTAWRYPGVFGQIFLQSGSFAFTDIGQHKRGSAFDPVVEFVNAFRAKPGRPSERVFMTCGMYESLIYENRSMLPLLRETGMEVRYIESRDGHNWENWRDRMRAGLSWLFPGPLWMVYE